MKYEIIETGSGTFVPVYSSQGIYSSSLTPYPILLSALSNYYVDYYKNWSEGIHCKTLKEARRILSTAKEEIEERENSKVFVKIHSL